MKMMHDTTELHDEKFLSNDALEVPKNCILAWDRDAPFDVVFHKFTRCCVKQEEDEGDE